MKDRPTCDNCRSNPKAINYRKGDKIYYRSFCNECLGIKIKRSKITYLRKGYKKKLTCEACGFIQQHPDQMTVINYRETFKTVCLNCNVIADEKIFSAVKPDF